MIRRYQPSSEILRRGLAAVVRASARVTVTSEDVTLGRIVVEVGAVAMVVEGDTTAATEEEVVVVDTTVDMEVEVVEVTTEEEEDAPRVPSTIRLKEEEK